MLALVLPLLLAAAPEGLALEPVRANELSVSFGTFTYQSFLRASRPNYAVEVAYHRPLAEDGFGAHLQLGAGVRAGPVPQASGVVLPAEAFVQLRLRARIGVWEAAIGPEVGLSGFAHLRVRPIPAEGEDEIEEAMLSPVYLALSAAPLRFHVGRFVLGALEFHVGTAAPASGTAIRLYLGLVTIGGTL